MRSTPSLSRIESLAGGKEPGVRIGTVDQARGAIGRTEQSRRVAGTVVVGVTHQFHAQLVVTDLTEDVAIADRDEVVELVDAAVTGQRQDALLGKQVVEFELAQLHVDPRTAKHVVKTRHHRLEVKGPRIVGRREKEEREVLFQRAPGM